MEMLYAFGRVDLGEMVRQIGGREMCFRAIDDLHRRRLLEITERVGDSLIPLEPWKWRGLARVPDLGLEGRIVLRSTPEGNQEWGRIYQSPPKT